MCLFIRYLSLGASFLLLTAITNCARTPATSAVSVVGGDTVTNESDPVMQSTVLFIKNGQAFCTGTLIGPNQISSAAHCFSPDQGGANGVGFAFGSQPTTAQFQVAQAMLHPKYTANAYVNDIAILTFEGALPAGKIPADIGEPSSVTVGAAVTIAGYGVTGETKKDNGLLRKVDTALGEVQESNREFIVKIGTGKGGCYGDSGGPLYMQVGNAQAGAPLKVLGATSRGENCDRGDGVYTDLTRFQGWMKCTFNELGKPLDKLKDDSSSAECGGNGGGGGGGTPNPQPQPQPQPNPVPNPQPNPQPDPNPPLPPDDGNGICAPGYYYVEDPYYGPLCVMM